MAAQKQTKKINLLPQEEFAASTIGRVLKWLLSSFRFIVIATEMFVMIAFLSRFWLDARISELSESIRQKRAIIESYSKVERDFRNAQNALNVFKLVTSSNIEYSQLLAAISSQIPQDVQITTLGVSGRDVQIKASAVTETSAINFITNLKNSNLFQTIDLTQIASEQGTSSISFSLSGTLKGGQNGS